MNLLKMLFGSDAPVTRECPRCGAIMDERSEHWPPFASDGADVIVAKCPECGHEERITWRMGV